jgi:DNA polymerase-4
VSVRAILHVDMDSFFASVEVLVDPSLAGKPVIVGGSGDRGVVASCNYEARRYGIHSAMPSVRARRLCPHAVFVHGRYDLYSEYSQRIHQVFASFTPLVEGISLDEAFLDVTGSLRLFGSAPEIAWAIKGRVLDELQLDCAVGVAATKFVAKLASKAAKPRASRDSIQPGAGVLVIEPGHELEFLHPLPVSALWGVGEATEARLRRFGVETVGDLAAMPVETLERTLGKTGRHLHELAWARDPRAVEPEQPTKSISHEETYAQDHHDHAALRPEAVRMADAVAGRLRHHKLAGRTVSIKIRFHDFATITRSQTLSTPTDLGPVIARTAVGLLDEVDVGSGVRLFGVAVSNLVDGGARQLSLDDLSHDGPWDAASSAVDGIRERFGEKAVGPAALVGDRGLRVKRQGEQQWGPS